MTELQNLIIVLLNVSRLICLQSAKIRMFSLYLQLKEKKSNLKKQVMDFYLASF